MRTNLPPQLCRVVVVELLSKFFLDAIPRASCLSTLQTVAIALVLKAGVTVLKIDRQLLQNLNLMKAKRRVILFLERLVETVCITS